MKTKNLRLSKKICISKKISEKKCNFPGRPSLRHRGRQRRKGGGLTAVTSLTAVESDPFGHGHVRRRDRAWRGPGQAGPEGASGTGRSGPDSTAVKHGFDCGQTRIRLRSNTDSTVVKHGFDCGQTRIRLWSNTDSTAVKHGFDCGQTQIRLWPNTASTVVKVSLTSGGGRGGDRVLEVVAEGRDEEREPLLGRQPRQQPALHRQAVQRLPPQRRGGGGRG
jgi:hypothetical protein